MRSTKTLAGEAQNEGAFTLEKQRLLHRKRGRDGEASRSKVTFGSRA